MLKFFGVHIILIGLGLTLTCIYFIDWQRRAIATFPPVPAIIDQSDIRVNKQKRGGDSYIPDISYHYVINNRQYISRQVTTFSPDDDRDSVEALVKPFPVGAQVFAYVNPADPTDAILVRQYQANPYAFALISTAVLIFGVGLFANVFTFRRPKTLVVPLDVPGDHLLLPAKTLRRRYHDALFLFLSTLLLWPPILLHYMWVSGDYFSAVLIFVGFVGLVCLVLLVMVLRARSLVSHLSDVRLTVNPVPMKRGELFKIRVEFDVYRAVRVNSVGATVTCIEHYVTPTRGIQRPSINKRDLHKESVELAAGAEMSGGEVLRGQGSLLFPATTPATTHHEWNDGVYPYYVWELKLRVDLAHRPDLVTIYPLIVE